MLTQLNVIIIFHCYVFREFTFRLALLCCWHNSLDMATNTSLSRSSHQKSLQDESNLVAGQQQPPEITPASNSTAVEGAELQTFRLPSRSGCRNSSDMATNTSLSGSSHQKSSQDESNLVAGQQQLPEITPASNSTAVEGAELQTVEVKPRASEHSWNPVILPFASAIIVPTEGIEIPSRNLLLTLLQNISSGDLVSVNKFLNNYSFPLNAEFLHYRSVLHAAIVLGQLKIFKLLLSFVSDEDLHLTDNNGNTAMSFAAMHGNTEIAECLFKRNKKLVTTVNLQGGIPVLQACTGGHKDTLGYLYSVTPIDFLLSETKIHGSRLLNACILSKQFDVAFDLIRQCPAISLTIDFNYIPLVGLATEKSLYLSGSRLAFWQRWIYYCLKENKPPASTYAFTYISGRRQSEGNKSVITQVAKQLLGLGSNLLNMFGIKQIYDLKSDHANAMELLRRIAKYISTLDKAQILQGAVRYAMIGAAKLGVTEFIIETGKANPDVMSFTDDHCRNIFMIAAIHRQEKVVSLICGIPALTGQLLPYVDIYGNGFIHLAAELGPDSEAKLTQISGAALQMQRELQWFK
ncbi:hypothetical protein SCA6_003730, partial [Theobroma cacao]